MPTQDASHIREKVLSILRMKGPTIPIHIAQETGLSMLFASAFLSELFSDKLIKMSYMRVGNSPIYFIPGQEQQLEKFSHYLKSKEKDAFILIQDRKFLKDSEQTPAIRVALRGIRDFAFPFKRNGEIIWRYLTSSESEFKNDIKPIEEHRYIEAKPKAFDQREREIGQKIIKDIKIEDIEEIRKDNESLEKKKETEEEIQQELEEEELEEGEEEEIEEEEKKGEDEEEKYKEIKKKKIEEEEEYIALPLPEKAKEERKTEEKKEEHTAEKKKEKPTKEKPEKQKPKEKIKPEKKKTAAQAQSDKFFDKIKEFLSKETIEILNIESFNKNEILLRIKSEGTEKLLVAYNKKKIADTDIINAHKKAAKLNLKYLILSMGEPSKKLSSLIESAQNLEKIEKIEK